MKNKTLIGALVIIFSFAVFIVCAAVSETMEGTAKVITVIFGSVVLVVGIMIGVVLDYIGGIYKCPKCGEEFKPEFKVYLTSPHVFSKRFLKCPKCNGKNMCKRISLIQ